MSVDRGAGDAEFFGDVSDGVSSFAFGVFLFIHVAGQSDLAGSEFWFLSAGPSSCAGRGESVAGAFGHKGVLKLGNGAQDLEEHPPGDGGRVDALVQNYQVNAARLEGVL